MKNINDSKSSTKQKLIIGVGISIVVVLALFVVLVVSIVKHFVPVGNFEGVWESDIILQEVSDEYVNDFGIFIDDPIKMKLLMDEQSKTYGHIRLIVDNDSFFLHDEIFTSIYSNDIVKTQDNEFVFEGEISKENNNFSLIGEFSKYNSEGYLVAKGVIIATKVSDEVYIFD